MKTYYGTKTYLFIDNFIQMFPVFFSIEINILYIVQVNKYNYCTIVTQCVYLILSRVGMISHMILFLVVLFFVTSGNESGI